MNNEPLERLANSPLNNFIGKTFTFKNEITPSPDPAPVLIDVALIDNEFIPF